MTAASPPAEGRSFFRRHRWKLILIALVVAAGAGGTLWTLATLSFSYSSGDRVGYVQKLSKKGWLCRTWEGEMALSNVPGQMPDKFLFTIRDDAVAQQVQRVEGERVSLMYEQHRFVPFSCFGETEYFVTGVRGAK